jgi:hypothetical protein
MLSPQLIFQVDSNPASPQIFEKISKWLSTCSEHRSCGDEGIWNVLRIEHQDSTLPLRVIDVGPADGSINPRLLTTNAQRGKYATLSYRWGTSVTMTTTYKTISSHQIGIEMASLPKTLRGAVHVTRKLGLRYLWVDSLCIIQDSAEDSAQQARQMHMIY